MSSYLNIYGVTKEKDEHILLVTYSRNNEIYQEMDGILDIPYNGDGGNNYRKLSISDINIIIEELNKTISNVQKRINEYEKHAAGNIEIINEIIGIKEYIKEIETIIYKLDFIIDMLSLIDLGYSGFSKIECCID